MNRRLLVGTGAGLALVSALPLLLNASPWPGALLIRKLFNQSGLQTRRDLKRYARTDVCMMEDIPYGAHPDERLDLYRPHDAHGALPLLVWVHGGGWVAGNRKTVSCWLQVIASHGYACAAIGYSTARPSIRYPTPVRQVGKALDFLTSHADKLGLDTNRFVLGGSSAGAQIAAQVAMMGSSSYARRMGLLPSVAVSRLAGVVLASGAFDIAGVGDNWFVNSLLWAYTGNKHYRRDPYLQLMAITPNLTTRFPPTFITTGNADPLLSQAHDLHRRMRTLGIDVDALFFDDPGAPRLQHEYQFELDTDAGQLALSRLIAFLSRTTAERNAAPELSWRAAS